MPHHDDPPRRHLHPVQPPPDPEHDGRPIHHNNPAEQAVLGALLLAPELAEELHAHLEPDDFYRPAHETVWNAIHHIHQHEGVLPDPVTVAAHLQKTGDLQRIGGAPYLHDLMAACPLPRQAEHYATQVRDTARLRRLQDTTTRLQAIVNSGTTTQLEQTFTRFYEELDTAAARTGPTTNTPTATGLRDLTWLLTGEPPHVPPPAWGQRTNGDALFYTGRVNGIYGDPESGKTWIAQTCIVEALTAGTRAAIIDVDHNGPQLTTERLLALGARPDALADPALFRYYEPDDATELQAAVTDLTTWQPEVAVLDSIGEMMPMLGIKSVDNDELSGALRTIASALARAGACVITIDHLPKNTEARTSGFAIGGTAKKRAIDGSYLHADARVPPAPGQIGKITLRIEKDRPGRLRATCTGKYVGTYTLDSTRPQAIVTTISSDSPITTEGVFRPTHLMDAISRYVEDNDQCTFRDIKEHVKGKDAALRAGIERLSQEGYLSVLPGPRNSTIHHSIAQYREDEDDQA